MADWPTWVQAAAAFVQAAAAIVIVALTRRLAKANDALVKATDSYAKSARDQVDELVRVRLTSIKPYLHVTWAKIELGPLPTYVGTIVRLGLIKVGPGPAFSVRAHAKHPWLKIVPASEVLNVVPSLTGAPDALIGAAGAPKGLLAGSARTEHAHDPVAFPLDFRARLEYRDLAGRWWTTIVPVRLEYAFEDERQMLGDARVLDQDEQVTELKSPVIGPLDWRNDVEPDW